MTRFDELPDHDVLRRFVVLTCGVGLLIAYATVIPLMRAGWLPPTITWAGVLTVPAASFAAIVLTAVLPSRYPAHRKLAFTACVVWSSLTVGIVAWQGWV